MGVLFSNTSWYNRNLDFSALLFSLFLHFFMGICVEKRGAIEMMIKRCKIEQVNAFFFFFFFLLLNRRKQKEKEKVCVVLL